MPERFRLTEDNRKWWTLGAMCFALFMIMLDNTVVNVALPSIQRSLHTSLSNLEWTVNAYTLTFGVLLVTGGRAGDIFGRRRMFLFGVMLFAASSAAIGLAPSDAFLIGGRAIQGIGAAFMMPGTLSIISNTFPPHERGRAIGTWAGVSALALALGPVVGGALTQYVSWRAIFYINVPVAIAAVAVTLFATHESRDETIDRTVDYPGIAALSVGLTALILALVESASWGWGSSKIIALLALSAFSLAAFVFVELKVAKAPMVQFEFFKSRTFFGANLIAFIVSFAMLAMFFLTALYIQNILGYSPLQAGVRFLPTTLMIVLIAPISGRLADRIGPRIPMTVGLALTAVALFLQTQLTVSSGYTNLLPAFVLMGIGMALVMSPMSTAAMNAVPATKAGVASGILSMNRMVGGTFGVALLGTIFQTISRNRLKDNLASMPLSPGQKSAIADSIGQSSGSGHTVSPQIVNAAHDAFIHGFTGAMTLSAGVAAAGAVFAFVLVKPLAKRAPETASQPEATAEPIGV
ncbi:MAG TPA: MFS transporter [Thermoleophilaceae bacterium]|jgi:EmrB/QacA subfamily drug resistance transporter